MDQRFLGEFNRYSYKITDQIARDEDQMNRPFYKAGQRIDGSVIQQAPAAEIMVIDFEKDEVLKKFYEDIKNELKKRSWGQKQFPELLNEKIPSLLEYSIHITNGLTIKRYPTGLIESLPQEKRDQINSLPPLKDQKVYLGTYITLGCGTCRQFGAIAAACMERFIDEQIKETGSSYWHQAEYRGTYNTITGHAWASVEDNQGNVFALDPVGHYFGPENDGPYPYHKGYEKKI